MRRIRTATLIKRLAQEPTQPVTIVTRTEPRMRKTGNPYAADGVFRVAERNGFIGADYERVINRQRLREGAPRDRQGNVIEFQAGQLWWGKGRHVDGNRHMVQHADTGALYLVFFPNFVLRDQYESSAGQIIPTEKLQPWLIPSPPSTSSATRKPIHWRLIELAHLVSITLRGSQFLICDSAASRAIERAAA